MLLMKKWWYDISLIDISVGFYKVYRDWKKYKYDVQKGTKKLLFLWRDPFFM